MKKAFTLAAIALFALSAKAQFTVYRPADVGAAESYTPSYGYGAPYTIYRPAPQPGQRQRQQPRMQEVTLTGYYNDHYGWHSVPIRVGVTDEKVILLSIKSGYRWNNVGNVASMVNGFDKEEIRDNFTYKVYCAGVGNVYF